METKVCMKCGKYNSVDYLNCIICGYNLSENSATSVDDVELRVNNEFVDAVNQIPSRNFNPCRFQTKADLKPGWLRGLGIILIISGLLSWYFLIQIIINRPGCPVEF